MVVAIAFHNRGAAGRTGGVMRMHVQFEEIKCRGALFECAVMHDDKVDATHGSAAPSRRRRQSDAVTISKSTDGEVLE